VTGSHSNGQEPPVGHNPVTLFVSSRGVYLEHLTFNQVVAGSIPARPTNKSKA
jgi:hypothetical protein